MEKITIKKIYFNEKSKAGTAYKDKQGNSYQMVSLYAEDGRTLYGRAYPNSPVLGWKLGQTVEAMTDSKTDADGKVWHHFRLPRAEDRLAQMVEDLGGRLQNLESRVAKLEGQEIAKEIDEATLPAGDEPPF